IQDADVRKIRQVVQGRLILEMAVTDVMQKIAREVRPELVTLVPETAEEITTLGGLDLSGGMERITAITAALQKDDIQVSIFIDPAPDQIRRAKETGADMVEIHTGAFCEAEDAEARRRAFDRIRQAVDVAHDLGLGINAGHGLCYHTIKWFAGVPEIDEFSIGHSIVSRAALVGLDRAVRDMIQLIREL
ncbi:MAG: pyridoxine 5'-phosphate synthase, partial [Desulfosudaceae bacterium]